MERWELREELFHRLLELAPGERENFLTSRCAGDADFAEELRALVASHEGADEFLSGSALGPEFHLAETADGEDLDAALVGSHLGPYRIDSVIASGGMGTVYAGERDDDEYRRPVAIKVIRRGMASTEVRRRFRQERQALAQFEHPGIASLLDGGTTPESLPYLVMERIDGDAIDRWCDDRNLSVPDRLRLFLRVCDAVTYAHRALVVHRDLKPPNILVTKDGNPRLLDFGVAKILAPDRESRGTGTSATARFFTPGYASPEQIIGSPVDTATDIYSLGVILYELLTGHRPHPTGTCTPVEHERRICEEEPTRPSAIVRRTTEETHHGSTARITPDSVSRERSTHTDRLVRHLRGDLDAIVLKALRKEPDERYSSVEQFAEDIRRHLGGLPVLARRGTARYRATKFMRRHHKGAIATALVLVSLVAGILIAQREAERAREAADRATRQAQAARRAREFIVTQLYPSLDPFTGEPRRELLRGSLAEGGALGERDLADEPEELVGYLEAIASVCELFRLPDESARWWSRVAERIEADLPWQEAALARARHRAGLAHNERGRWSDAKRALQGVLAISTGPDAARVELDLARSEAGEGRYSEARERLERIDPLLAPRSPAARSAEMFRVDLALSLGRGSEAVERSEENLGRALDESPVDSIHVARLESQLARALRETTRFREAERFARRAVDRAHDLLPVAHPLWLELYEPLLQCLADRQLARTAEVFSLGISAVVERTLGPGSLGHADAIGLTGRLAGRGGGLAVSKTYCSLALDHYRALALTEADPRVLAIRARGAQVLVEEGLLEKKAHLLTTEAGNDRVKAEATLVEAIARARDRFGPDHWRTARLGVWLARAIGAQDRFEEAESILMTSLTQLESALGERHPEVADAHRLFTLLLRDGYEATADPALGEKIAAHGRSRAASLWSDHPKRPEAWGDVAVTASIDFEDDFLEKSIVLESAPDERSTATLWIYGRAWRRPGHAFLPIRDLTILVNDHPGQQIRTSVRLLFQEDELNFHWVPLEIPIEWLREGENRFLIVSPDRTLGWETNNLLVGVDAATDENRSWWFGNGFEGGYPAVRDKVLRPGARDDHIESDMALEDPSLLDEGRAEAQAGCVGELMIELVIEE